MTYQDRLAADSRRIAELEAELAAATEELRRRHARPLPGQSLGDAIRTALENADTHIAAAVERAAKAERDIALIAECVENDDCDHLPLVERVAGMRDSLMLMIGKWMDGRGVQAECDTLRARAEQSESMIHTWEAATRRTAEEDGVQYVGPNTASAISDKLRARAEAAEEERDKDLAEMRRFQCMVINLTHRAEAAEAEVDQVQSLYDEAHGKLVLAEGEIERLNGECQRLDKRAESAEAEAAKAKNALMISEQYRQKYRDGKLELYSMGGEICDAAMKHLPCGEGPLERYEMEVEREHSPKLVAHMKVVLESAEQDRRAREATEATVAGLIEAAEKIRHWHDWGRDNEGMVVSSEAVRGLWKALAATPAQHAARIREEALRELADELEKRTRKTDLRNDDRARYAEAGRRDLIAEIRAMADEAEEEAQG